MSEVPAVVRQTKPFNTAVLFSGGGFRFGYYLGMYQALCEQAKTPDIILASCGGVLVAGLLEVTGGDSEQAFERLQSRECYDMLCRITPKPPKQVTGHALPALQRLIVSQAWQLAKNSPLNVIKRRPTPPNKILDRLAHQSIATIKDESADNPLWPWQPSQQNTIINSLVIASRLYNDKAAHQWQVVLRCSQQALANEIEKLSLFNALAPYQPDTIHSSHWVTADMPLAVAVRASISDMYYLPPLTWQSHLLMGGVLNLTPIELACELAHEVYAETKANYDRLLAEPAIYSTFGFLANQRLAHVHQYQTLDSEIHWIKTADNAKHIRPAMAKKLQLRQGYIDVTRPDYATFQAIMREQYNYGYERTIAKLRESS